MFFKISPVAGFERRITPLPNSCSMRYGPSHRGFILSPFFVSRAEFLSNTIAPGVKACMCGIKTFFGSVYIIIHVFFPVCGVYTFIMYMHVNHSPCCQRVFVVVKLVLLLRLTNISKSFPVNGLLHLGHLGCVVDYDLCIPGVIGRLFCGMS